MKNFKLLLATATILSTGLTANVMAEDEPSTTTLDVTAELLAPDMVIPVQHIDFARIILDTTKVGKHEEVTVVMDPATGNITQSDASNLVGETKNGKVSLQYTHGAKKTIQLPNTVYLHDLDGNMLYFFPDFVETYSYGNMPLYIRDFGIGGRLNHNGGSLLFPGKYSGEMTVTVIADEG